MQPNDTHPFIEKVANDTREYLETLMEQNRQLCHALAAAEIALDHLEEQRRDLSTRYGEIEQQNTNLANLYVASYQLNGTLDRRRVLEAIKEVVINLIGSEELAIWETRGDSLVLLDSVGIDAGRWRRVVLDDCAGVIAAAAANAQPFVALAPDAASDAPQQHLTACIPLKLDEIVIGMIGIFRLLPQKRGFAPIDLELFDLLASHAATALYCTRAEELRAVAS